MGLSASPVAPSYEGLVRLVAVRSAQLAEQASLIEAMRVELAVPRVGGHTSRARRLGAVTEGHSKSGRNATTGG